MSGAMVILSPPGIVIPLFARFRFTPVMRFNMDGLLIGSAGLGAYVSQYSWLTTEGFFAAIVENLEAEMANWK